MRTAEHSSMHEETWLLLPWLANDRLSGAQRERAEEHVRLCSQCAHELSVQRLLCEALSAPERVTYAPGPSFRKLLERLDGPGHRGEQVPARDETSTSRGKPVTLRSRGKSRVGSAALWRPPGLAWAASFILMVGMTALVATAYRWSEPRYGTRSDPPSETHRADVLQIAFDRKLTIGEVEGLLRADGALVVEGPSTTGIFGVTPVARSAAHATATSQQMLELAARLRADPRVRWVQPIDTDDAAPDKSSSRGP